MKKGQRFGYLTAIRQSERVGANRAKLWWFKCKCGNIKEIRPSDISSGVKSCGCMRKERNEVIDYGTHLGLIIRNNKKEKIGECLIDKKDYEKIKQFKINATNLGKTRNYRAVFYNGRDNDKRTIQVSRFLIGVNVKGTQVDHINGNPLDNRRANLRICTNTTNNWNKEKTKANTSGYKGVNWAKAAHKWEACIKANGIKHYLGLFTDKKEAAQKYNEAALKYHGKYAKLNEIN